MPSSQTQRWKTSAETEPGSFSSDRVSESAAETLTVRRSLGSELEAVRAASEATRRTVLEDLIEETATEVFREFLCARFPTPNPRSPFAPLFERLKDLGVRDC